MKLLLTSSGLSNRTIGNALLDLAGKPFGQLNLLFIPTAANVEEGDKSWLIQDYNNCKKLGFSAVDIIDIAAVSRDVWLPRFEKADILLFGGGDDFYLIDSINNSGVGELLPKLLETKIYIGISAGSMITAKELPSPEYQKLYYTNNTPEHKEGLGLVDFQVLPHFNSPDFPEVNNDNLKILTGNEIKPRPGSRVSGHKTIYALDDNSAIKVSGNNIEVVSEGKWEKYDLK